MLSPNLIGLLSFIPGLGFIIFGQFRRGFLFLFGIIILLFAGVVIQNKFIRKYIGETFFAYFIQIVAAIQTTQFLQKDVENPSLNVNICQ